MIVPAVLPVVSNVAAADILTEPAYPATVTTFADASLTYSFFSGDYGANLAIVGNQLRLVNGTGIDYSSIKAFSVIIEAANASTTSYFTVTFAEGSSWFESDAIFAWDATTDADNAALNPAIGGAVALTGGTGATIISGLFDMDANIYRNTSTGMSVALTSAKSALFAFVLDKDNHTAQYTNVFRVGGFFGVQLYLDGAAPAIVNNAGAQYRCGTSMPAGKSVYWGYYNQATGNIHTGINQVEAGTSPNAMTGLTDGGNQREITVGGDANAVANSLMKHGSMQIVNRTGLTLAQSLAIVQKMQTLHGI